MDDLTITLFDPIKYFDFKGITYSMEGPNTSPGWINIDCPWCGDNLKHLGIHLETNACNCWRCGRHNIGKLIQLIEDCSWSVAMTIMEAHQNYKKPIHLDQTDLIPTRQIQMPKEFSKVIPMIDNCYSIPSLVQNFLYRRGFNPTKLCQEYELYYSPGPIGKYKFRLGIPIYMRKQLVSFMTRDVTGQASNPYISCDPKNEAIPYKCTLYGYDDISPNSNIIIVEGPTDQWKLGKGSLATWGTGWTMEQVSLLRSLYPKKVFILFDSEDIAQQSALRLSKAIWFCDSEILYLDGQKDPGELTVEEGKELMEKLSIRNI